MELQYPPCSPAHSSITIAPDLSPKLLPFQGAVGACSSTGSIMTDKANMSVPNVKSVPLPKSLPRSPDFPMDLSPQDTVGACSSVESSQAAFAKGSPPSQVEMSISPELPKEHSPHGVVGACSNTECSGPALRSCSTSSSDVSPAKKLFPVFQRGLASSQDALGSKKLSRKLKTSRRVSRVAASLEKQSLLLQFYDKELKNSDAE